MKKTIALLAAALLLAGLTACGKTPHPTRRPKRTARHMEATISGDTIEVNWIGTDAKSLYWKGTYQAPTEAGDWKWTSQGDTETMAQSLLASQDATKDFTYSEADGVSWETTALGTTITVKTTKQ